LPIQAVVFDMDGVLIDSEGYWFEVRSEFAAARGKSWSMDDQYQAMGRSTRSWAEVMQKRLNLDMSLDDIIDDLRIRLLERYERHMPILPGAIEAVHLSASAYRVALASGSPTWVIQRVVQLTGLDKVFQAVIYGDDMVHGKPAPDIYLEAARRLDVLPRDSLGIEDSANGIRSLKAAGMVALAVPSPSFPLPDEIVKMVDLTLPSLEHFTLDLVRSIK
jgi:mannitol-1-/sugar-/sorbitol-6-/2-deoxyglucose-6-phosphatase